MTERQMRLKDWLSGFSDRYGLKLDTMRTASADAGFRSYFRIDGKETTYIVMDSPGEADNIAPFIHADEVFAQAGLNVPKIYEENRELGLMLISDLGTKTYLDVLDHDNADR